MKTINIIAETEKKIESILSGREKELGELDEKIQADNAALTAADAAMAEATERGDLESFFSAKKAKFDASTAKEMHEARLDKLKNKPLISSAEYEQTVAGIFEAIEDIEANTKKALCSLSDQMAAAAADLESVTREANAVLQRWQRDVYRDADRTRNKRTGEIMPLIYEQKEVNTYSTINWGRKGIEAPQYEAYKKSQE